MNEIRLSIRASIYSLLLVVMSCQQAKKDNAITLGEDNETQSEADFVSTAIANGYEQLDLLELARSKSQDEGIIEIAKVIQGTANKRMNDLKSYASNANLAIPGEPDGELVNNTHDLSEAGPEFDKMWCDQQIALIESTLKSFENHMEKTDDSDLRNLIVINIPALKSSLNLVQHYRQDNLR